MLQPLDKASHIFLNIIENIFIIFLGFFVGGKVDYVDSARLVVLWG